MCTTTMECMTDEFFGKTTTFQDAVNSGHFIRIAPKPIHTHTHTQGYTHISYITYISVSLVGRNPPGNSRE
eukprot:NODE_1372_length_454_cov_0.755352_g1362_i0.p2 GENE.NODE_1372_length_454_cov_0.755352_g1362_i0~~NODE_1372_length_454_cov_0.755352_g1362_i0.p2  ORF type:complete len:71 (+),score=9.54 NODE_1372_length_454_cov_0.755352_g1362_i0:227-439(+)